MASPLTRLTLYTSICSSVNGDDKSSPGIWLEVMLKLKLQYFDHLMQRADSMEKTEEILGRLRAEGDDRG